MYRLMQVPGWVDAAFSVVYVDTAYLLIQRVCDSGSRAQYAVFGGQGRDLARGLMLGIVGVTTWLNHTGFTDIYVPPDPCSLHAQSPFNFPC